jgi:SlyX protein
MRGMEPNLSHSELRENEALEIRLMNLEVKLSFTEDLVESLNELVAQQQVQIQWLAEQVRGLRQQGAGEPGGFRSLRDELPPHY